MQTQGVPTSWVFFMSEPILPSLAGFKVWLIGLPVAVSIVAFVLGLLAIPLRKGQEVKDLIYRLVACVVSSFLLGIPALIALMQFYPQAFDAASKLSLLVDLHPSVGTLVLIGCVMLLCSLPGPWVVASTFLFIEKFKGKPLDEVYSSLKGKENE